MLVKKYLYNSKEYASEYAVRQAILKQEKKIFGKPATTSQWSSLGVLIVEENQETPIAVLKSQKMVELDDRFNEYRQSSDTFVETSLGFRVNANVTAFDNVSGLVAQLQYRQENGEANPTIGFMTFDDSLATLSLDDLKTIQVEISLAGSNAYAKKWEIRKAIEQAQDEEALNKIDITFG